MASVKEKITDLIQSLPEDTTYEEVIRELAFEKMIERGIEDSRNGRVISNEEIGQRIRKWQK